MSHDERFNELPGYVKSALKNLMNRDCTKRRGYRDFATACGDKELWNEVVWSQWDAERHKSYSCAINAYRDKIMGLPRLRKGRSAMEPCVESTSGPRKPRKPRDPNRAKSRHDPTRPYPGPPGKKRRIDYSKPSKTNKYAERVALLKRQQMRAQRAQMAQKRSGMGSFGIGKKDGRMKPTGMRPTGGPSGMLKRRPGLPISSSSKKSSKPQYWVSDDDSDDSGAPGTALLARKKEKQREKLLRREKKEKQRRMLAAQAQKKSSKRNLDAFRVNQAIRIWWSGDGVHYNARITGKVMSPQGLKVKYDDDESTDVLYWNQKSANKLDLTIFNIAGVQERMAQEKARIRAQNPMSQEEQRAEARRRMDAARENRLILVQEQFNRVAEKVGRLQRKMESLKKADKMATLAVEFVCGPSKGKKAVLTHVHYPLHSWECTVTCDDGKRLIQTDLAFIKRADNTKMPNATSSTTTSTTSSNKTKVNTKAKAGTPNEPINLAQSPDPPVESAAQPKEAQAKETAKNDKPKTKSKSAPPDDDLPDLIPSTTSQPSAAQTEPAESNPKSSAEELDEVSGDEEPTKTPGAPGAEDGPPAGFFATDTGDPTPTKEVELSSA